jgi:hypothetical protein
MPFASKRQQRFMFARHPKIAKKMVKDARRRGQPIVSKKTRRRKR